MILKSVKVGVIALVGACAVGGLIFGADVVSYVSSSARSVQSAVKDAVPIDFELKRARDLLEDIIPEMQANIRLIAQEEVEVAALGADITQHEESMGQQRLAVAKLRDTLGTDQTRITFAGRQYNRRQVTEDLARRFNRLKEAEVVLAGKHRLLETRDRSLQAAMAMLDRTRSQKVQLHNQIESLEAQYRLVKANAVGSRFQVDRSSLAKTEKLIRQIKKRLDVAERVLAHESRFVELIPVDVIDEKDLVAQIDEHMSGEDTSIEHDSLVLGGPATR